jgi:hypothetical protein
MKLQSLRIKDNMAIIDNIEHGLTDHDSIVVVAWQIESRDSFVFQALWENFQKALGWLGCEVRINYIWKL